MGPEKELKDIVNLSLREYQQNLHLLGSFTLTGFGILIFERYSCPALLRVFSSKILHDCLQKAFNLKNYFKPKKGKEKKRERERKIDCVVKVVKKPS